MIFPLRWWGLTLQVWWILQHGWLGLRHEHVWNLLVENLSWVTKIYKVKTCKKKCSKTIFQSSWVMSRYLHHRWFVVAWRSWHGPTFPWSDSPYFNGHFRNRFIGGTYHIYIYKAYVREYPHKIWPYMVQYLHFRILDFPLTIAGVISHKMVCSIYWLHRIPLRIHWWLIVSDCNGYCGAYPIVKPKFPVSGCDLMTVDV